MPEYRFSYKRGRVTASFGVTASGDSHAFKRMQLFTRQHSVKYIAGSMHTFGDDGRWRPLAKPKVMERLDSAAGKAVSAQAKKQVASLYRLPIPPGEKTFRLRATR